MDNSAKHSYEFGPFRLIPAEQQLLRDGRIVPLTPKSFDLLVALVENSGRLVGKEELLQKVWPDSFVEEANLSVKMSELRRALGERPQEVQYIETVPRRGYRFVAAVKKSRVDAAASNGTDIVSAAVDVDGTRDDAGRVPSGPDAAKAGSGPAIRKWAWVLAGLVVISAFLISWNTGILQRQFAETDPARVESLAVLPMDNLSGDPSQDYFADGMTEALTTELARIGALRVVARPSVVQYKGAQKPLKDIGRELSVDALLTGSVVRSGDRVRIAVQLTHVASDRNLWADSYERDLRDVLALQKEVTRDIVGEIRVKLTPQEQGQFGKARPVDPEAYDHYLRGKFYLHSQDIENNEAAIASLEQAVAFDPTFAAAHAELAMAYVWKGFLFAPEEGQLTEKAYVASEKALALDPDLAVAHLARGRLLWTPANNFPHEKAIQEYRRALALDPNLDEARNQLALIYCHIGAFDEAIQESQKAIATKPGNNLAQFRIGETLNFQGKHEQALSTLRATPQKVNPALVGHQVVWALFNLGRKDEALAEIDRFLKDHPEDNRGLFTSLQAMLAASSGQEVLAEEKIRTAIEKGKGFGHFHHTAYHIASAYTLMNKPDQAMKWLEAAADDGFPCYPLFERDGNLNNIRTNSRFQSLMARLNKQSELYRGAISKPLH